MGIIQEGREALKTFGLQQEPGGQEADIISGIMANLSEVTDDWHFTGDPETALVHHFGERVFTDEGLTEPYTDLVERIEEEKVKDGDNAVPVLIVYPENPKARTPWETKNTVFAKVVPGPTEFTSKSTLEEGVKMHERTDDTADVKRDSLALVAKTITFSRLNILEGNPTPAYQMTKDESLTLRETRTAEDDKDKDQPGTHTFQDSEFEILSRGIILIGWEEIDAKLSSMLIREGRNYPDIALKTALSLKDFFEETDELTDLGEKVPQVEAAIEAAVNFIDTVEVLGRLSTK